MNLEITTAIILAAGSGSRMGEIGKSLPKPLWPFFSDTLLSFQIKQLKKLGIKNILINTHHQYLQLHHYIESLNDSSIQYFFEKEILGSGGGITNIVKLSDEIKGHILIVNCDVFLDLDKEQISELKNLKDQHEKILLTIPNNGLKYNKFYIKNKILQKVDRADEDHYVTYSGFGIFKTSSIIKSSKYSNFFDTVANYNYSSIYCYNLGLNQYFDFGTQQLYLDNILNANNLDFLNMYLKRNNINIKDYKIKENVFCFDLDRLKSIKNLRDKITEKNIIILKAAKENNFDYTQSGIYFEQIKN